LPLFASLANEQNNHRHYLAFRRGLGLYANLCRIRHVKTAQPLIYRLHYLYVDSGFLLITVGVD